MVEMRCEGGCVPNPAEASDRFTITKFLNDNADFHKLLLDELYDAVYFVDPTRRVLYWNHAAEALSGFSAAEVVGRRCSDNLLCHVDESGRSLCQGECPLSQSMQSGTRRKADVYMRCKNGHRLAVSVRVVPIMGQDNQPLGAVEIFSDIAMRKQLERRNVELKKMAYLDPLTKLANRRFLDAKIRQSLDELALFGRSFGILLLDLDRFKRVNDSFGHSAGDVALEHVAGTISSSLRAGDTIGRWGGEEFLAILPDTDADQTLRLADRCRMLVRNSGVSVTDMTVTLTLSVGATVLRPSDTEDSLFRRVDRALYQSKLEGRDRTTLAVP
jgi:diguanylate cyclase (GGDEF)-like protein/PAS domain S-box-containing protein